MYEYEYLFRWHLTVSPCGYLSLACPTSPPPPHRSSISQALFDSGRTVSCSASLPMSTPAASGHWNGNVLRLHGHHQSSVRFSKHEPESVMVAKSHNCHSQPETDLLDSI